MSLTSEVRVVLNSQLHRFTGPEDRDAVALREQLHTLLSDLVHDLTLPIGLTLEIQPGEPGTVGADPGYRIWIDNRRCRGPSICPDAAEVTAVELARRLARLAYQNRELLVTASLAQKVWEDGLAGEPGEPQASSPAACLELLSLLVRRCFKIERGQGVLMLLREPDGAAREVEAMFEESVGPPPATRLVMYVGAQTLHSGTDEKTLEAWREKLFHELGLILPRVEISVDDTLRPEEARFQLNDVRLPPFRSLTADGFLAELTTQVHRHAAAFVTRVIVDFELGRLRDSFPAVVDAADAALHHPTALTSILRELVNEDVSTRDLRGILEALLEISGVASAGQGEVFHLDPGIVVPVSSSSQFHQLTLEDVVDHLRRALRRPHLYKLSLPSGMLEVYLLPAELEMQLRRVPAEHWSDQEIDQLIEVLSSQLGPGLCSPSANAVLTAPDTRRRFSRLIEKDYPCLPVLSRQELDPLFPTRAVATLPWTPIT